MQGSSVETDTGLLLDPMVGFENLERFLSCKMIFRLFLY